MLGTRRRLRFGARPACRQLNINCNATLTTDGQRCNVQIISNYEQHPYSEDNAPKIKNLTNHKVNSFKKYQLHISVPNQEKQLYWRNPQKKSSLNSSNFFCAIKLFLSVDLNVSRFYSPRLFANCENCTRVSQTPSYLFAIVCLQTIFSIFFANL